MGGGTDEAHAFSPAAELVAEWQRFRFGAAETRGRVEPAMAKERRREVEVAMIEECGLTLPPETYPWDGLSRADQVHWRRRALRDTRRSRVRRDVRRFVRRVVTLRLWR